MKKHLSIRIDYDIYSKLMDQANQDGLTVSESVRNLLENQTNNETPTHQPEKPIEEHNTKQTDKMTWDELNQLYSKQQKEKEKNLKEQINKYLNIHAH